MFEAYSFSTSSLSLSILGEIYDVEWDFEIFKK